ncbi:MAG TPA: FKBP-type peptidyl-prolyl cis-trans isomerase [Iamia sp.]|nr:FKBP-type peptidyl-prolyl cis-trans isomerase [Iamia sp.]
MRLRSILVPLAGLTLLLALASCGDDADDAVTSDGQAPSAGAEGPETGEHWHVAYAFQACGEVLPPAADRGADALGIHTHEDGLIHVHPFVAQATGADATLGVFLDQIGAQLDADGLQLADADAIEGCDGDDAVVRVGQWDSALDAAEGAEPDRIITQDFADIVLAPDLSAVTVAVGPEDDPIEPPPATAEICALAAADGPTSEDSGCGESEDGDAGFEGSGSTEASASAGSAAGLPCVEMTGDAGEGAPEVAVPVGPPPTELVIEDEVVGDGAVAAEGDAVTVDYVGVSCSTGEVFDASYRSGQAATFDLTPGSLIEGFATGVEGMAVGGRRLVVIPSDLAYGAEGSPPAIAPDETLIFVIDLREVG